MFEAIAGSLLILVVLWEVFETMILPRRVTRQLRLTRIYYRWTWQAWSKTFGSIEAKRRRESFLSFYGPLSLLGLLLVWAIALIFGFGLLHRAAGSQLSMANQSQRFLVDLYMSGTTFFTLGLGDVTPLNWPARILTVTEAGMGFAFLAITIGYLPTIYQSFSRREVIISMLDARAGSPPTALELLRRHRQDHGLDALERMLRDWEEWSAELLESHLSYPVLAYFRSQHDNQSWLAALTTILDVTALIMAGLDDARSSQARLTFAIARHAVVDLAQTFNARPGQYHDQRLVPEELIRLHEALAAAGLNPTDSNGERLAHYRHLYEPYVGTLARYLHMQLPQWIPSSSRKDNWQTTAWDT